MTDSNALVSEARSLPDVPEWDEPGEATVFINRLADSLDEALAELARAREPQSEPSDAQVDAAEEAIVQAWKNVHASPKHLAQAALRAAGQVKP